MPLTTPSILVFNQQRPVRLNLKLLRRMASTMMAELFPARSGAVAVHFVASKQIAELNERFLGHEGPTDVITFDYRNDPKRQSDEELSGEIFVCVEMAQVQARRYRVGWPEELARYVVHGLLHLAGENDHQPRARVSMKKKEDQWVKRLRRLFPLSELSVGRKVTASLGRARPPSGGRRAH